MAEFFDELNVRMDRLPTPMRAQPEPDNELNNKMETLHMRTMHIAECVRSSLESYLTDLRDTEPDGMYDMLVPWWRNRCWKW